MIPILAAVALLLLGAAAMALTRRNLIHAALWLVVAWSGVAAFYLWAGAEFLAFAQVLIYVGAISMVVLFAVLLTRRRPEAPAAAAPGGAGRAAVGLGVGLLVTGVLVRAVLATDFPRPPPGAGSIPVRRLGAELMEAHAAALLVAGVILTVALIGAVVLAAPEARGDREEFP